MLEGVGNTNNRGVRLMGFKQWKILPTAIAWFLNQGKITLEFLNQFYQQYCCWMAFGGVESWSVALLHLHRKFHKIPNLPFPSTKKMGRDTWHAWHAWHAWPFSSTNPPVQARRITMSTEIKVYDKHPSVSLDRPWRPSSTTLIWMLAEPMVTRHLKGVVGSGGEDWMLGKFVGKQTIRIWINVWWKAVILWYFGFHSCFSGGIVIRGLQGWFCVFEESPS